MVSTGTATSVGTTTATINGTVNPGGGTSTCSFDYGTSTAYGSTTSAQSIASETASVSVTDSLSGLSASTTYHFRLNCSNSAGTGLGADASFTTASVSGGGARIRKVFYVMEENRNASDVYGASDAPYINNTLMTTYDYASNYVGVDHPSEPNYVWLEAGADLGLTTDNDPSASNSSSTTDHIVNYLGRVGKTWRSYQEDLPGSCGIFSSGNYASKHNPFVFFQDVVGSYSAPSAFCTSHIVDLSQLATDVANNTLPDYVEITPNLCDDGHDCGNSSVESFLQSSTMQSVIGYVLNPANEAVLFILWDEDEGSGFLPMLLIAPPSTLAGTHQISSQVDHSSFVRSMQLIYGVDPSHTDPTTGAAFGWLRNASGASDMSSFFAPGQFP